VSELREYSSSLRQVLPSADLDARIAASIQAHTRVRRPRPLWRRPLPWAIAAASVAIVAVGLALLLVRATPEPVVATQMVIPSNQYSLWPTEGAVFRVKASMDSAANERQYWVDVRVANDGSMRIVRVIPANSNEGLENIR
jgi:hypothetical protein